MIQWYIPSKQLDSSNINNLIFTLLENNCEVYCNDYIPFGGMDYSFIDLNKPIFVFGHIGIIKDIKTRRINIPLWFDYDRLKCSCYYSYWGDYIFQDDYAFYPLSEVKRKKESILNKFGSNDSIFLRPDDNIKTFTGKVINSENYDSWLNYCIDYMGGSNCLCIVSTPKNIEKEYRLIIIDNEVVTGSLYNVNGQLELSSIVPESLIEYAKEIITVWQPHPVFVLDIAEVGGIYKVLECGSIHVAGLYNCDLRKFVDKMNKFLTGKTNTLLGEKS